MSTIRFLHAGQLRLATPLSGLADSPAWLQQLSAGAVRQAVHNLAEAAIANGVQFVLLAGRVTECAEDLPAAAEWLKELFRPLKDRGIAVVSFAETESAVSLHRRFCSTVVGRDEVLHVSLRSEGGVRLTPSSARRFEDGMVVTSGQLPVDLQSRLSYHAVASSRPAAELANSESITSVRRSAGVIQACAPEETWNCGVIMADADLAAGSIRTCFRETDVLRFMAERLHVDRQVTPVELIAEIVRASDAIERRTSQTVIADWVLRCDVRASADEISRLQQAVMLAAVRERLQGGHRGVWPRSIVFTPDSTLQLAGAEGTALEEYLDVANGPVSTTEAGVAGLATTVIEGAAGLPATLVEGLELLVRAA